jgi:hypothetical protein
MDIYNDLGQRVDRILDGRVDGGNQQIEWRPNLPSGVYFCRMEAVAVNDRSKQFVHAIKLLYIK